MAHTNYKLDEFYDTKKRCYVIPGDLELCGDCDYPLEIHGNLSSKNCCIIHGYLKVKGDIDIFNCIEVNGHLECDGKIKIGNCGMINGSLKSYGIKIGNNIQIHGFAHIFGDIDVGNFIACVNPDGIDFHLKNGRSFYIYKMMDENIERI